MNRTSVPTAAPHPAVPTTGSDQGPIVVWRTWLLQPDGAGRPILTGLNGFRWFEPEMDAKCLLQDTLAGDSRPGAPKVDRHHPVIPDVHCSCGIYAGTDELVGGTGPNPPRGVPYAGGFVALSGRVLLDGNNLRAQHATIIGPLTLAQGRRPLWQNWLPSRARPIQVRIEADHLRYRTIWTPRAVGEPVGLWLDRTAIALTERYRVGVEIPGPR